MLTTGTALFLSESVKCYYNQVVLGEDHDPAGRTALHLSRAAARRDAAGDTSTGTTKVVAALSMMLWFTVAAAGRWIGFS